MSTGRDNQAHSYTRSGHRRQSNRSRRSEPIRIITPLYSWPDGKEGFDRFTSTLRRNNRAALDTIHPMFDPFRDVDGVVEIYYTDGSPSCVEVR
jgi:hypothetical protein